MFFKEDIIAKFLLEFVNFEFDNVSQWSIGVKSLYSQPRGHKKKYIKFDILKLMNLLRFSLQFLSKLVCEWVETCKNYNIYLNLLFNLIKLKV